MGQYTAVLQDKKNGPYRTQRMTGNSAVDLLEQLLERRQVVVDVFDHQRLPAVAQKRINALDKVFFFEQLEASSAVGVEPARAMEIAHNIISEKSTGILPWMTRKNPLKQISGDLSRRLQQGQSLGEAASGYPNLFDKVALGLIEAGEHSGSMVETFSSIRQLASRGETVRSKIFSISIYPVIILAFAAFVVYQLATGPLPQFAKVLEYFKGELPWYSKLIVETGKVIGAYPILYLGAISALVCLMVRLPALIRRMPALHPWILRIPGAGQLIYLSLRANFIQTLSTLKKSKLDSLKCLLLLQGLSWCYPYRAALSRAYRRVANGESIASSLGEEGDLVGRRTIEYLKLIEETGADVEMLDRLAAVMNRDLDNAVNHAETIAKPLIVMILAGVIGLITAAVYGPLIELYNRL
jgi:type II secretory pathway component PulF